MPQASLNHCIQELEQLFVSLSLINSSCRYQCQINLYHYRQIDTEDAFNIFMVLQMLWQRPVSFWKHNFSFPGATLTRDVGLEMERYWRMMRHVEDRNQSQFLKIIIISIFLLRVNRLTSYMTDTDDQHSGAGAGDLDQLLEHVPKDVNVCDEALTEDEKMIAEIIVNIFLIQDSNTHPVFRLDTDSGNHQVGLETLGETYNFEGNDLLQLPHYIRHSHTQFICRQWSISSDRQLLQPLLLP